MNPVKSQYIKLTDQLHVLTEHGRCEAVRRKEKTN